ncbi:MAG: DUF4160 domain-containing protein [Caldilineaceae bacterium]|nr:DUF4160 domain-containing protein [Caldilineaceae bacterium]MCB0143369.1 DUF4160 domain-containing protein [Caldilineaceae bacterium]MCB9157172.1 DUF4160 domain-containing protein [Caldilineaceae bacterium]
MPEISRFYGIIISIYLEENVQHHLPHFHVRYQQYRASYGIEPVSQLAGALPVRQQRLVEAWAEIHQEELKLNWDIVQQGGRPDKVHGLE